MPIASGVGVKYVYIDHDSAIVNEAPPTLNQWYTLFNEVDVRLIYCAVKTTDLLAAGATFEVRWTIDGNVYFVSKVSISGTAYFIFRDEFPGLGGTGGLWWESDIYTAAYYADKRGHDFKVEVRVVSAVLATDILEAWAVFETLEAT